MHVIQCLYSNAQSHVRVNVQYNEEFDVGVGMHQDSVLSLLLLILLLEALSQAFCTGVPWELLCVHDLVLTADTERECQHVEDQVSGLWRWSRCPQEIWQVPLLCLPQWSRQYLYLVPAVQAVDVDAPCLIWRSLSAICVCSDGAVTVPLLPDAACMVGQHCHNSTTATRCSIHNA